MKYLKLNSQSNIPVLGLGTWQLTGKTCQQAVEKALKLGYRHIDTADAYGNHQQIAKALKTSRIPRDQLFITSKLWLSNLNRKDVLNDTQRFLEELQTNYIDLLLIHWPNSQIPLKETLDSMNELKMNNIIKAIGVSNFTTAHLNKAISSGVEISNNQVEIHPSFQQKDLRIFCKNKNIILTAYSPIGQGEDLKLPIIVELAKKYSTPSIAFTYNDPIIFGEYVIDISKIAHEENIKTVMVTNGYIDKEARKEVFEFIDAANVDLKAFSEKFYHKLTFSHLEPVLDTLIWLKKETNVWFEITTLLIPNENDSDEEINKMCEWIVENLGDEVPLHFTAFHPDFKMTDKNKTPSETLFKARKIAINHGIKFCYLGNIWDEIGHTTFCPNCKKPIIKRSWHDLVEYSLKNGHCKYCGYKINGFF